MKQEKKDTLRKIKFFEEEERCQLNFSGESEFDIAVEDAIDLQTTSKDNSKRQKSIIKEIK